MSKSTFQWLAFFGVICSAANIPVTVATVYRFVAWIMKVRFQRALTRGLNRHSVYFDAIQKLHREEVERLAEIIRDRDATIARIIHTQ
jgi:hypothetical protein